MSPRERARYEVQVAIKKGLLVRPEHCQQCGELPPFTWRGVRTKIHAHHPDYAFPLAVQWLCGPCHLRHHGNLWRADKAIGTPGTIQTGIDSSAQQEIAYAIAGMGFSSMPEAIRVIMTVFARSPAVQSAFLNDRDLALLIPIAKEA